MTRLDPTPSTIKKLFARSRNLCAFPGCSQELVTDTGNLVVDICHIEAAEPNGQRYNPRQTDEERRSTSNLILLCPTHHRVTNDEALYPASKLVEMKQNHEQRSEVVQYIVDEQVVTRLLARHKLRLAVQFQYELGPTDLAAKHKANPTEFSYNHLVNKGRSYIVMFVDIQNHGAKTARDVCVRLPDGSPWQIKPNSDWNVTREGKASWAFRALRPLHPGDVANVFSAHFQRRVTNQSNSKRSVWAVFPNFEKIQLQLLVYSDDTPRQEFLFEFIPDDFDLDTHIGWAHCKETST